MENLNMNSNAEDLKINFCLGCLSHSDEKNLQRYRIKLEPLKSLFQVEFLYLCYICIKMTQKAEAFIQNVQSNQIFMENLQNITDGTMQMVKNQYQMTLTIVKLDSIELNDDGVEESAIVYSSNKIKLELKEEGVDYLKGEFVDDDEFSDSCVKEESESFDSSMIQETNKLDETNLKKLRKTLKRSKMKKKIRKSLNEDNLDFENGEDDCPLKHLIKAESTLDEISLKTLRRTLKTSKIKNRSIRNDAVDLDQMISIVNITKEECMKERLEMLKDPKYSDLPYKCEDCIVGFTFKPAYEKHMEKHSKALGEYECDICKRRMATMDKLISHKRYHRIRYKCNECDLLRISRLTIKDHFTAFHLQDTAQYKCSQCDKKFKRVVSLRKHVTFVHLKNKRAQCNYCQKTYANTDILKTHMINKHPTEVTPGEVPNLKHICQDCGVSFKSPSQLKYHMVKHSVIRDYYCVECDRSFKSSNALKQHLRIAARHVNYMDLPLKCLHCTKRFHIRRDLEQHMNRVHLNIKPFQCDKCDKAYVNSWSLTEHKRFTHEGQKRPLNFPCPRCEKVFERSSTLKSHIRTHTGERPYPCLYCAAKFSQSSVLSTHVKLVHLNLTRDGRPKRPPLALK